MWWRLKYSPDKVLYGVVEYFATPLETLRKRRGDCEDWAWLAHDTLLAMGLKSQIIDVRNYDIEAHALCCFFYKDVWHTIDTAGLRLYRTASQLNELPGLIAGRWKYWTEYQIVDGRLKPAKRRYYGVEL